MKLLGLSALAWVAGVGAYLFCLKVFWGQSINTSDLNAVSFWSAAAVMFAIVAVYAPMMFALRHRPATLRRWWVFSSVGIGLAVVPLFLIIVIFGGSPVSPEAGLFYCMFATFGVVFGTGFYLAYVRR